MDDIPVNVLVAAAAFPLGIGFGALVRWGNFCTMGAISDILLMGDWRRFRAWMLAIAVAMAGSQALHVTGLVDLGESIYLTPNLGWAGAILGGYMFGFGMVLAGGCGSRNVVRLGGGNLKALVAVVTLGLVAYATLRGILALPRVRLEDATGHDLSGIADSQGIPDLLAAAGLGDTETLRLIVTGALVGLLVLFAISGPRFLKSPKHWVSAILIGLTVPAGWAITGILGADDFDPARLASLTFVAPVGEGIVYLLTYTGATINFGIAAVAGAVFGGFLVSIAEGSFRIESFADGKDFLRHLVGGALMGCGGVLALGCTVGQGLTGIATLAAGSLLAVLAIIAGAWSALKHLLDSD
jgi:hypothetical protein